MKEDKIIEILESLEIPSEKIDEVVSAMKEKEYPDEDINVNHKTFANLKEQMEMEPDWRKKASLAAKIISLGLDN